MFKRLLLSLTLLAVSAFASDWTGSTSEPENTKRINGKAYYIITTAEELAWFAAQVNGGNASINAYLANDIQFMDDTSETSSISWTPIGKDSKIIFNGTLDGNGKTIYGLFSKQSNFAGLLGVTGSDAVVKNVTMTKSSIKTTDRYSYAGGIVAVNSGTVSGCTNSGAISYSSYSGGIVAVNNGTVSGCTNSGAISYSSYSSYSGGIVAVNNGTVSDCINLDKSSKSKSGLVDSLSAKGTLKNSFSYGKATYAGIIRKNKGTVTNAYYDSDVLTGESTVAPNSGMTTAAMQKDQFAWVLNTTDGTEANSKIWSRTDSYPIFADAEHLPIYKIVFDDGLGGKTNRYTNYKGQVPFPDDPEPEVGYLFIGWFNSDGEKISESTLLTGDQTVTAVYTDAKVFYSIRFFNADSNLLDSQSVQHGLTPKYPGETPTLAATAQYTYTFAGWNVEPTTATEDFDYYATYTSTVNSYTVTFLNDGETLLSSTFLYGATPGYSGTPTRASTKAYDYTFVGWTPAIVPGTAAATYSALYDSTKVLYTVTFLNGSETFATVKVPYGEAASAPSTPTRTGYKFIGWNSSISKITADLTVSALFEKLIYRNVFIYDDSGSVSDTVKVENNQTYVLPKAPAKTGYAFDGWYDENGKRLGAEGDTVTISADTKIMPKYTKLPDSSSSTAKSSSSSAAKSSSSVEKSSSSSESGTAIIAKTLAPKFHTTVVGRSVQISGARVNAPVTVFDMQGRMLRRTIVPSESFTFELPNAGSYVLRIGRDASKISVK